LASHLIKTVRKLDNLERAWRVIQENGRTSTSDAVKLELETFGEDAPHNLRSLQARLNQGTFKFAKARGVPIPKLDSAGKSTGKHRPIVLAPVQSRIVQRAILNVLLDVDALGPFVQTPYSFGGIRGEQRRVGRKVLRTRTESPSAVPAAIKAILTEIEGGARFVVCADIRAFFTKIPKPAVTAIVADAVNDEEFLAFFRKAIDVELSNLAELREKARDFPIEEIGVAQGSSLSPLLGNIVLASFDREMNEGDCRCIRYIDDFIILAPTERAANARMRKAQRLLASMTMELSPEKSSKGALSIRDGFDFLGINVCPGLIRPASKAQERFLSSLDQAFDSGRKAMIAVENGQDMERSRSLIATLKRVDGMIDGWGKHYWFCNDTQVMRNLDLKISEMVRGFLGAYRSVRGAVDASRHNQLLGLSELSSTSRDPFLYPSVPPSQQKL